MKVLIGLCGLPPAGKETVAQILAELAKQRGVALSHYRSREILGKTAALWKLGNNRSNFQKLVRAMEDTFGEGALTTAMRKDLEESTEDIVIFDAVRLPSDEQLTRELGGLILCITAHVETRYERMKQRRREGEEEKTIDQFLKEERASTEVRVAEIGDRADYWIGNNCGQEELRLYVEEFWITKVDPLLQARE